MGAAAPKPLNFRALSKAWDDPIAFARELSQYYRQLEASGHRQPTRDRTTAIRKEKPMNTNEDTPTTGLRDPAGLNKTEPGLYTPADMQKVAPGLYAPKETQ
ncbi:hypothetical protein [Microbacterium paraoxydans]|uniref:Uncharacterized protein n=1 Tax=Microbacterium paraoxydans TaxID=199592 RepID=A0A1H1M9D4_9MICO|nr:hypothetical protein [Microbacterium paraoxydans]SDR83270.1 hypothetical protein SAMN04489809_0437 [Microbacterium paraoxydans]